MAQTYLYEKISMDLPESFRVMSAEELDALYRDSQKNRCGAWDEEQHIRLTLIWQKAGLLGKIADLRAMVRRNEMLTEKGLKDHGYQCEDFFELKVDAKTYYGYRYHYQIQGIDQIMETVLLRRNGLLFNLSCACRTGGEAVSRQTLVRSLETLQIEK